MKTLDDLVNNNDSALPIIQNMVSNSGKDIIILEPNINYVDQLLLELQVSTKSFIGAIVYHTGGILVDKGWIRVLGSGNQLLHRNLSYWNQLDSTGKFTKLPGAMLVADDILGGFYAVNGGFFEGENGIVYYLAPDTLEWECLNMNYSNFISWIVSGNTDNFYKTYRWNNWEEDIKYVKGDECYLFYPFLWSGNSPIELRKRNVVSIQEIWDVMMENYSLLNTPEL